MLTGASVAVVVAGVVVVAGAVVNVAVAHQFNNVITPDRCSR